MTETIVWCRTNCTGVSLLRHTHRMDNVSAVHGVIETEDSFADIRVAKFSKTDRMLSLGTLEGVVSHIEVLTTIEEEEVQTVAAWVQGLTHQSKAERDAVLELLEKYFMLFDGTDLGSMAGPQHEIQIGHARPVHQAPYRDHMNDVSSERRLSECCNSKLSNQTTGPGLVLS